MQRVIAGFVTVILLFVLLISLPSIIELNEQASGTAPQTTPPKKEKEKANQEQTNESPQTESETSPSESEPPPTESSPSASESTPPTPKPPSSIIEFSPSTSESSPSTLEPSPSESTPSTSEIVPFIATGKAVYVTGETLNNYGIASPNVTVIIQIFDPLNSRVTLAKTGTDENGNYAVENVYTFLNNDLRGKWTAEANWLYNGGQYTRTTFTLSSGEEQRIMFHIDVPK